MERRKRTLSSRIRNLLMVRTVVVTVVLVFTALMQVRGMEDFLTPQLKGLYTVSALAFLLNLCYAVLHGRFGDRPGFSYAQLMLDNVLISLVILMTGGVRSIFSILFFLTVIGAGIMFYRRGGLIVTLQGSACYALAIGLPFLHRISPLFDLEGEYLFQTVPDVVYRGTLHVAAFLAVAYLGSHLSESLRNASQALVEKESDLAELQSLYEDIVQSISSGLVTTTLGGIVTSFNRAAEKITKGDINSLPGSHFLSLFRLEAGENPFDDPGDQQFQGHRCEGHLLTNPSIILGMTFSPLRDEGGETRGIICSFQDLTEIRKLEEQIERSNRLAAIGEMAAGVAHEIRNPLASISGSVEVLREEIPQGDTNRRLMDIVTEEAERLNRIITDFLLFANPRPLKIEEVDVVALVEGTLEPLRKSLRRKGDYHLQIIDESGGMRLSADSQLIRQVFWNLSLNAIHSMPGGGALKIRIGIDEPPDGETGDWMVIEFQDTGRGIARENLSRIFTPFFSTKHDGTGLGLAIVFKIVEQHRGLIEVDSREGKGSTFRLRLPSSKKEGNSGER